MFQVEYKEMDEHLAHISEDEFYSEEEKKDKDSGDSKEGTTSTPSTTLSKDKDSKDQKEVKPRMKEDEANIGEESDHSADDPSGTSLL